MGDIEGTEQIFHFFFCFIILSLIYPFRSWHGGSCEISKQFDYCVIRNVGLMQDNADVLTFFNNVESSNSNDPRSMCRVTYSISLSLQPIDLKSSHPSWRPSHDSENTQTAYWAVLIRSLLNYPCLQGWCAWLVAELLRAERSRSMSEISDYE